MGAGKTTVGKELAALLHYSFLDTDQWIEKEENQSITSIFEQKGEDYFREKEAKLISSIKDLKEIVVAVGGGLPCYNNNMTKIRQLGTVIYLKAHNDKLFGRLKEDSTTRPLLRNKTDEELKIFIAEKLQSREKYFEKAHHTLIIEKKSPIELAQIIKKKVNIQ